MSFGLNRLIALALIINFSIFADEEPSTLYLDLEKAEDIGIENSPELKMIGSQQKIKKLLVNENWRQYFPTASIRWDRSSSIIENTADSRNQRFTLNVDQVVYDGGRRSLALDASLGELALAKYDVKIALNKLRFKIRTLFFSILSKKSQLITLERSIKRQSDQLFYANRELQLGETTKIKVLELENRLNEIILQEKTARIDYESQIQEFKILLRLKSSSEIKLIGNILGDVNYNYRNFDGENLINLASNFRVEFDKARAEHLQTQSKYKYAQTFYIPTVSVGGFHGYRGDEYPPREREYGFNFRVSMLLGPNSLQDTGNYTSRNENNDRFLTSSTTLGIYDNLQYQREIVTSGNAAYQAKVNLNQIGDIIASEVKKSLNSYRVSWDAMKQADENVILFEKRIQIKEEQVRLGEAPRTELAETEIRYLEAKNAQIASRLRFMSSIAELELATGLSLDQLGLIKFGEVLPIEKN